MSYDIWLEVDLGGIEPSRLQGLDWNYTSNCAPMWHEAMPETNGLAGMTGMEAGVAAVALEHGIERMQRDPAIYEALDPENGWGSFHDQLAALDTLLDAFRAHPKAKVAVRS